MTIEKARRQLFVQLDPIYGSRESASITDWIMERLTGMKKIDRVINKTLPLLPDQTAKLEQYTKELLSHKPVQYVLQEAWFLSREFYVNEQVLIPRPETEELVQWIIDEVKSDMKRKPSIIDIGTGSGCIAVSLKAALPQSEVFACDISKGALEVAKENAITHDASIDFIKCDFLNKNDWRGLPETDIIVINPPYVPLSDRAGMEKNVTDFEPSQALFVPDADPYIFYSTLAEYGKEKLKKQGSVYAELHKSAATSVNKIFRNAGFQHLSIRKDMQGVERMMLAQK